ncbi:bifunctional diaminohydroxyphosphoribosylaminopyrimidine deaminase/5-amino-6-(5-phosphoribosylamino)uracil reductase RibD [Microbacterium sp. NPDC076911]|uniref:bifunctional diaminohydroxyphosphoribosylaminopyrimidine deaminase/5-amino-6-(5-phosphoribosylamino)uracil reductase RibD n=1 Tax=Microbacterium sp. NPDC076911 TaxID=3154958 RepID=UPI00342677F9
MAVTDIERGAMRHALSVAPNGPRGVNPQVGAVILSASGEILADGWHRGIGTPHAEVDALSKLTPDAARGATAIVTLEPCNHTGRTGPCSEALIAAGIARVVYAVADPGEDSAGGAQRLRDAGIDVDARVLEEDAAQLLESWLTVQRLGRPHVTVKWAQSLDGRAAATDGTSKWITGPAARADVHRRRAQADAIVAGTGTVLADDPALTARNESGELFPQQPLPVVIGSRAIPDAAAVRRHPRSVVQYDGGLAEALDDLARRGVQRVFVEGGPTLASAFVRDGLADEILTYVAPVLIGGDRLALGDIGVATISQARRLTVAAVHHLGDDLLVITNPTGESEN